MAEKDDDPTTSEDHFGKHDARSNSGWASAIVIVLIVIIVGAVFYFAR
jgi:hypothetical protein